MKMIKIIKKNKTRAFLSGIATVLDIGVTLRRKPNVVRNDAMALKSDWKAVGKDLRVAIGRFKDDQKMSKHLDK